MPGLDVSSNLIQDEGDDVWLHCQEQHVTVSHCFFVAPGQVHPQLLQEKTTGLTVKGSLTRPRPPQGAVEPLSSPRSQLQPGIPCLVLSGSALAMEKVSTGAGHG